MQGFDIVNCRNHDRKKNNQDNWHPDRLEMGSHNREKMRIICENL